MEHFDDSHLKLNVVERDKEDIVVELENTCKHHSSAVTSVLYFEKCQLFCTSSTDKFIKIHKIDSVEPLHTYKIHNDMVYQIIKWNESEFISCSYGGGIFSCTISPPYSSRLIRKHDTYVCRLLKLNDNLFVCRRGGELHITKYLDGSKVKILDVGGMNYAFNHLVKSKMYPNCFYATTDSAKSVVKLVDYENYRIIKEFDLHGCKNLAANCITIVYDQKFHKETLFTLLSKEKIHMYNTSHKMFDRKITDIIKGKYSSGYESFELDEKKIICAKNIGRKYIVAGTQSGLVILYRIVRGENETLDLNIECCKKAFGKDDIVWDLILLEENSNFARICCSGRNGEIKVFKISGLKNFKNSIAEEDVKERILFLSESIEEYIFTEIDKKRMFRSIKLLNDEITNCPIILL